LHGILCPQGLNLRLRRAKESEKNHSFLYLGAINNHHGAKPLVWEGRNGELIERW